MKQTVLVIFLMLFFLPGAWCSPVDSSHLPWHLPLHITLKAEGLQSEQKDTWNIQSHNWDRSFTNIKVMEPLDIWIDTSASISHLSMHTDTLLYSKIQYDSGQGGGMNDTISTVLSIIFVHGTDSIASLQYDTAFLLPTTGSLWWRYHASFQISRLKFNDTSIYCSDSSQIGHGAKLSVERSSYGSYGYSIHSTFASSSIRLGGLFQPTFLSNPTSGVHVFDSFRPISVMAANGGLQCDFAPASRRRTLQIFSLLGVQMPSVLIPEGVSVVEIPPLPQGAYLIRLDLSTAKIAVR